MNTTDPVLQYIYFRQSQIELALITALEQIEGRVPNNDEVKRYAVRVICHDGTEFYKWKDYIILKVNPPKFNI